MMLVLLLTAGWQVHDCEPHTTHGAGWGLLIMTWLLCTLKVWSLIWLLRLVEDEIICKPLLEIELLLKPITNLCKVPWSNETCYTMTVLPLSNYKVYSNRGQSHYVTRSHDFPTLFHLQKSLDTYNITNRLWRSCILSSSLVEHISGD